jgi:hypothetical protein
VTAFSSDGTHRIRFIGWGIEPMGGSCWIGSSGRGISKETSFVGR